MKYIKLFEMEKDEADFYYHVPYNNLTLIEIVLEKLKVYNVDKMITEIRDNYKEFKSLYLFIYLDNEWKRAQFWVIRDNKDDYLANSYADENHIYYKGEYELEPYEVSAVKYNI